MEEIGLVTPITDNRFVELYPCTVIYQFKRVQILLSYLIHSLSAAEL